MERPYWRRNVFKRVVFDQKYLVTDWWGGELRRLEFAIPLLAATAVASGSSGGDGGLDPRVQRSVEDWTSGGGRGVAEAFTDLGDVRTGVVLIGSTYLISRWAGNDRMARASSLSAEALLNGAIYVGVFKRLTRRTRPAAGGTGQFFVQSPQAGQQATSFPSGHATGAFAVATVFAIEFSDKRWVRWVAYGTASLVALSRVGLGRHFLSDVVVGGLLGHSIGRMVSERSGRNLESRSWRRRFEPLVVPETRGLGIAYRHSW